MSPNIPTEDDMLHAPPPKKKKLTSQCMPLSGVISSVQFSCKSSTQNAPKLALLSSKIEKFSGEGQSPLLRPLFCGKGGHSFHTPYPYPPRRLDSRAFGARSPICNRNRRHCRGYSSISLKFGTDFDRLTLDVVQAFKVKI